MNNWVFGAISLVPVLAFPCLSGVGGFIPLGCSSCSQGERWGLVLTSDDACSMRWLSFLHPAFVQPTSMTKYSRRWSHMTGAEPWLLPQKMVGAQYLCRLGLYRPLPGQPAGRGGSQRFVNRNNFIHTHWCWLHMQTLAALTLGALGSLVTYERRRARVFLDFCAAALAASSALLFPPVMHRVNVYFRECFLRVRLQ